MLCNLEDLKLYIDIFIDIGVPRLFASLIMNKNGLFFPMCRSMTAQLGKFQLELITKLTCNRLMHLPTKNIHLELHEIESTFVCKKETDR